MELSPHAKELLGRDCRQGQCLSTFPCAGHPLVTCQLIDDPTEDLMNEPARIINAAKGDLFLAPGNALGFVGAILAALRPSQHYTHMGIFVDDGVSVRHATASSEHLQEFANGSILGTKAPSNGFEPDALRYGWPGTLTQSVENAWAMTRPGLKDDRDQWIEDPDLKDPETGRPMRFRIDALSFDPVPVQHFDRWGNESWETRWPLVVKPCLDDEARFSHVRRLLHRVADAASAIRGHYRFYAYSDATIAFDPQYAGPPVYERTVEVGDPGATDCALEAVEQTIPVMCSSLVWAAIERVRRDGTPIVLNWSDDPTWKTGCRPAVQADSPPTAHRARASSWSPGSSEKNGS
jgi:hypothetical protein